MGLGGYGSEESSDADEQAPKQAKTSKPSDAAAPAADGAAGKKKVISFSKLPVQRPLLFDSDTVDDEAPLRKAAEAENLRAQAGKSILSALPPPKVTLGSDTSADGSLRIDLSEVKAMRAANKQLQTAPTVIHTEGSIMRGTSAPEILESDEVPKELHKHPMFNSDAVDLPGDRPSADELHQMRNMKFISIAADDMKDPDWYMSNQVSGGPGLHKGKKVASEVSMYEAKTWAKTTHADPSRVQKRKHQINWLAHEAMDKEAELLDRAASSRLTKAQTSMKYGW